MFTPQRMFSVEQSTLVTLEVDKLMHPVPEITSSCYRNMQPIYLPVFHLPMGCPFFFRTFSFFVCVFVRRGTQPLVILRLLSPFPTPLDPPPTLLSPHPPSTPRPTNPSIPIAHVLHSLSRRSHLSSVLCLVLSLQLACDRLLLQAPDKP